ncbi:MAG: twin-arginine translocase subunit TatC [Actinobacteria bacterium]|nr:MAG: twin-arginine translocase subunit TatC [Actinomycetota bacterium]
MPVAPKRMPFFEHIAELRKRLIVVVVTVVVLALGLYTWGWQIFDFVLRPVQSALELAGAEKLNILGPFATFTLRFKVATYAAIVVASPIIIWQVMAFFLPALKPKEQRYVVPTFGTMVALFIGGIAFCYIVVAPTAFEWMVAQAGGNSVQVLPDAALWFQAVLLLLFAFGLGFQLPVIVFYLMIFNIVPYNKLRANWRYAYVIIVTTAAIATPDWSPVTMGALAAALIVLYEGSMLLARIVLSRRIGEQKRREAIMAAGGDPDEIDALDA